MGTIAATLQWLLYGVVVFFNRIIASFTHHKQLHNARFARIDELASLLSDALDSETSLLMGVGSSVLSHMKNTIKLEVAEDF
jgi:hypothetical protein